MGNLKWPPPIFTDPLGTIKNKICLYFFRHPERAITAVDQIVAKLQKTNETSEIFAQTINFLESPENQQNLINGTGTCLTFLNGFGATVKSDIQNAPSTLSDDQKNAWNDFLNTLQSFTK